jgi:hypothetical protein
VRARPAAPIVAALVVALVPALGLVPLARAATTNAFPPPSGGPRAVAMGGHLVALVRDDHALDTNPGRLVYAGRVASAQVDRLDPDLDLWRGRVGVAFGAGDELADAFRPLRPRAAAFGAALDAMTLNLIEGSSYRELTASGGAALSVTNFASVGVTARYQRAETEVVGAGADGFGVDVGFALNLSDRWDAGLAVRDAFGRAQFESSDDEDHAARATIGVATNWSRWQAELDYVLQYDHTAAVSAGAEVHAVPGKLDVRAGLSREAVEPARTVFAAGAGFTFKQFQLDYAFQNDADGAFEQQHRFALSARF